MFSGTCVYLAASVLFCLRTTRKKSCAEIYFLNVLGCKTCVQLLESIISIRVPLLHCLFISEREREAARVCVRAHRRTCHTRASSPGCWQWDLLPLQAMPSGRSHDPRCRGKGVYAKLLCRDPPACVCPVDLATLDCDL